MKLSPLAISAAALFAACGGAPPPPAPQEPPPRVERPEPLSPPPTTTSPTQPLRVVKLENALTAVIAQAAPGRDAVLQFGLFAGSTFMAPGAAELSLQVLTESADPSTGRSTLSRTIERLGGTLAIRIGPETSWLDMRVPGDRWEAAVTALRQALEAPVQSRHQIERMREQLVAARSAWIRRDPVAAMARVLLLGDPSTASYVHALLDRDPGEVGVFQARLLRPERAVFVAEIPDETDRVVAALGASGATAFGSWNARPAPPGALTMLDRSFQSGLYWSPAPEPKPAVGGGDVPAATVPSKCRIALVLFLPNPANTMAIDLLLLHVCLTLDGTGGRLEHMQNQLGLGHVRWHSDVARTPDACAVVLTADVESADVQPMWRALQLARSSLRDVPPSESELAIARRRAPLTARLQMLDDGGRLRTHASLLLAGRSWAEVDARLASLAANPTQDVEAATNAFLELPVALVAVGGTIPDGAADVRRFELLPGGEDTGESAAAARAPGAAAGAPWLERAAAALGGSKRLRRLAGWESKAKVVNAQAPGMTDATHWRTDGTLQRTRELLGQEIVTTLDGDKWYERLGDTTKSLDANEASLLRRELQRHPLALVAAFARGELAFRPIAQRDAGDRDVMVLEATGERSERLRVHIDTESHLIRVVETWETLPDDTVMHVHDAWSDYRSSLGLRAPFHRLTTQNDGQNRVETVYSSWVPDFAAK